MTSERERVLFGWELGSVQCSGDLTFESSGLWMEGQDRQKKGGRLTSKGSKEGIKAR